MTSPLSVGDPGEEEDGGGEGEEGGDDPADDGQPGASQRAAGPSVTADTNRVNAGPSVGEHATIAAHRGVAARAGACGDGAAVNAARVPVVVLQLQLARHPTSLASGRGQVAVGPALQTRQK